jgi:hypothetical protein
MQSELDTLKTYIGIQSADQTSGKHTSARESVSGYGEEENGDFGSVQNGGTDSQGGGQADFESPEMEEQDNELQQEPNLTMSVWVALVMMQPPQKLVLIVIRKMFNKGIINEDEKGRLKLMILSGEKELVEILERYEKDGNETILFTQIKSLLQKKQ